MKVLCYARVPKEDKIYAAKLAFSMHLALQGDDGEMIPLNHNSGILYAKATQNSDGTLNAKSMKNPWLFQMAEGTYGVIAVRIEPDGRSDSTACGKLLFFTSDDLIHYVEQPLLDLGRNTDIVDAICSFSEAKGSYGLLWKESDGSCFRMEVPDLTSLITVSGEKTEFCGRSGDFEKISGEEFARRAKVDLRIPAGSSVPEGAMIRSVLEIPKEVAQRLKIRFLTPENTANEVPEQITATSLDELKEMKAIARYSDGSSVEKPVDWYAGHIDWSRPGSYEVEGMVHQNRYEFPVAWNKADPCICKWKGKYYFISTNDLDREHTIYMREADSIPGLVTARQVKILDAYTYPHLVGLLWAPELHIIEGKLYIFHAGTPQGFLQERSHVMVLKENGNPMKASDWEAPVPVLRRDGSYLYGEEGITLDMTVFEAGGRHYACWSQRQFKPVDQGAWLYIALIDSKEPWKLTTDPVLLSMPEYGWANNHTFVDEGPFALKTKDKLYLTFSSAAVDSTYVVGLMSTDPDADLLNPDNWLKENYPLLSSRSVEGEFGTGHNAYVTDDDGLVWNTYHARPGVDGPRSTGIRRVHFNAEGFPVLDLTEEKDLKPELAQVKTLVVVPEV